MEKIDFVIPWVDGNDPEWQKSFRAYLPESKQTDDTRIVRYRDWDNLRYWFRGVEKFAPWVNKIHFITCGQVPAWLNLNAPKLHFVKHSDYIPQQYLPTFSSIPIELNMHRIEGLAERFVYFNDDFFLINTIQPKRFFQGGLPCDMAVLNALSPCDFLHISQNDLYLINKKFDKREVIMDNVLKWLNYKYGSKLFRTIALLAWPKFTGFYEPHLPNAFLKSTLEDVWGNYEDILSKTSVNRFRSNSDVNQYLFRYWQIVRGSFVPTNICKDGVFYAITDDYLMQIERTIRKQKKAIIVLNDGEVSSFEDAKKKINDAFESILPEKSVYEK